MSCDQIISYFFRTFFYENINLKWKIVNSKFYSIISSNQTVYLRNNLSFKLIFDDINHRVVLSYHSKIKSSTSRIIYWNYSDIAKTFISKLSFLALVIYNKYVIKNSIYVHYYNMDIYRGKNNRISLLKSGDIYIKFNISSKKNISDDYVPHYHGTEFIIKINSIDKLFKKIEF